MAALLRVVGHTLGIYFFLIAALRLVGSRHPTQFTVVDLLIIALMGSAVETAMVAGDVSLPAGLASAGTLLLLNRAVNALLLRVPRLRRAVVGMPLLLVDNGRFLTDHLRRVDLSEDDVREAIRERQLSDVTDVRYAVLEIDGQINIIPKEGTGEAGGGEPRRRG